MAGWRLDEEPYAARSGVAGCAGFDNATLGRVLDEYRAVADARDGLPIAPWVRDVDFCALNRTSRWECTPTLFRFPPARRSHSAAASRAACAALRKADVHRVLFHGESTTRHAYWGFLLLLTGDYSAVQPAGYPADCEWATHIGEAMRGACRHELADVNATVCDGAVSLDYREFHWPPQLPSRAQLAWYDLVVWGWQGHGTRYTRSWTPLGVNDAAALGEFLRRQCQDAAHGPQYVAAAHDKIVLLNTHPRFSWKSMRTAGECPDRVARYHRELPRLWRELCDVPRVASVWNAVVSLVETPGTNWSRIALPGAANGGTADFSLAHSWWRKMSVDGVHWGTAVNLLKAWAIIEQVRPWATGGR